MPATVTAVLFALAMTACDHAPAPAAAPVRVEVVETGGRYRLLRGGEPYEIRGAGMVEADYLPDFVAHGGNSIRTWTTRGGAGRDIGRLLDEAHDLGVTVALTLPMRAERHGFDYRDASAVAAQLAAMREDVLRYRDHPALLFWIIGNELNHSYTDPVVFDAVREVAAMIRGLDPNHPVTTALSGFHADVLAELQARAPNLDFISVQVYGSLFGVPDGIAATGLEAPLMVTEWGTIGWWEMERTPWGAPVEMTSSEKAAKILEAHTTVLEPLAGQVIGSYVFFWGQKQERTPTWFGLLTEDGRETEAADVMHRIWRGRWPDNRAPRVEGMTLDGRGLREAVVLRAGSRYDANLQVTDPDGDPLDFRWEVKPESAATQVGGDREDAIASIDGLLSAADTASVILTAPPPGPYRLYAYAYDDQGNAAHANIPFLVEAPDTP